MPSLCSTYYLHTTYILDKLNCLKCLMNRVGYSTICLPKSIPADKLENFICNIGGKILLEKSILLFRKQYFTWDKQKGRFFQFKVVLKSQEYLPYARHYNPLLI